jgi:phenylacetate-coenzyme A ligase PaaK-like adenylate-forming protein
MPGHDASYREQLAYLYARSAFYREKLTAAGFPTASDAGGLAEIAQLPLTEKAEIRATTTGDNPIGAHLCADPAEIVRIYSTSGTTGTPSFIPLTQGDLEHWITTSARSYAASGIKRGERVVTTYNAGPFAAGAALAAFDRIGGPAISGHIRLRPAADGVKQDPPLPVRVELARGATADAALAEAIRDRLRSRLVVQTQVELVPWGSLQRSEYKSTLLEH